jgi:hypothetical protein
MSPPESGEKTMPEPQDHADRRNWIETILRHVPGFHGYLEREYRRESDELLRNALADRLQRAKRAIDEAARRLVDAASVEQLPRIERLRARIDRLLGRIRGAMQGYSGFFDLVRINEAVLERVYDHDATLAKDIDEFVAAVERLPAEREKKAAAVDALLLQLDEIERRWDEREDILKGVK